jgi:DMSO/TMAO reductase YedYZ molybdopterin-dependent catalytic subunit
MMERRQFLGLLGLAAGTAVTREAAAGDPPPTPTFTGPAPNPYWTSVGPYVVHPQKLPLIQLTDRPVQLETPRAYFGAAVTPNAAFYVRWHLPNLPDVDLATWRLQVDGAVDTPLSLSMADLIAMPTVQVIAVNQCSGNSRSRFQPRVPGGQWGNGGCGCAHWLGVPLSALLEKAGLQKSAVQIQFQGLETGNGPEGMGSHAYAKSLDLNGEAVERAILAYSMNGEPLPGLNGFPIRLVVPGYFATYWVKSLGNIRVLDKEDDGFWMKTAYRIPDTPRGNTTPDAKPDTKPISTMPVRSFLATPDGQTKLLVGTGIPLRGVAFSGRGAITDVDWSADDGKTWKPAVLGQDYGRWAFRPFEGMWTPTKPGKYVLAVRARDGSGEAQPDEPVWNGGGYGWNRIERQEVIVADTKGAP